MKKIILILHFVLIAAFGFSQKIFFPGSIYADSLSLQEHIRALSLKLIDAKNATQSNYPDDLFRLQILAGKHSEANTSLKIIDYRELKDSITPNAIYFPFKIYNDVLAADTGKNNFGQVFTDIFYKKYDSYNNDSKIWVSEAYLGPIDGFVNNFQSLVKEYQVSDSLTIESAMKLCRAYLSFKVFTISSQIAKSILKKIEKESFIIQDSILLRMPDGGTVSLIVVRDKKMTNPMPVVMMYSIYAAVGAEIADCKEAVYNGYIGIVANTRGKRMSADPIAPLEYDAKDAYQILDWISKQPWCNGKIGMYGGSYLGFAQWSAVKYLHPALKTIVPQVSVAPGIDFPFNNGVFKNSHLRWLHFVTNNRLLDTADNNNGAKWNKVNGDWFKNGSSFRSLDSMEGTPNKIFHRWLSHPAYDQYWQNMTPQKEEFARINIPILTTTGYWDGEQMGAMYYYKQYQYWNKNPGNYLVIGPYDHIGAQAFPEATLTNYSIDSVANIPILKLVYKWFDYILKDSAKPSILKDKVNFEIMGRNEWRSVPSLDKMANDTLNLYFQPKPENGRYALTSRKPRNSSFIAQTVDMKDRTEMNFKNKESNMGPYPSIIDSVLHSEKQKLIFISAPVEKPFAICGSIIANIVASINKKDLDIMIGLYEQTPDGKYFALNQNLQRASFAKDRTKRQLLTPGKIEKIVISNTYITCKELQKGSRIVVVMGVNRNPNWQINYGTGKDVSDETMKDAADPMKIKWYSSSCIKVPILKGE
jgi:putative CocE/NonD family hydrolase